MTNDVILVIITNILWCSIFIFVTGQYEYQIMYNNNQERHNNDMNNNISSWQLARKPEKKLSRFIVLFHVVFFFWLFYFFILWSQQEPDHFMSTEFFSSSQHIEEWKKRWPHLFYELENSMKTSMLIKIWLTCDMWYCIYDTRTAGISFGLRATRSQWRNASIPRRRRVLSLVNPQHSIYLNKNFLTNVFGARALWIAVSILLERFI